MTVGHRLPGRFSVVAVPLILLTLASDSGAARGQPTIEARLRSADAAFKGGRLSLAVRELERATKAAPKDPRPHRRLAAVFRRAQYLDREIDALETALRRAPGDAESALRLAEIYIGLVWFDKGREKVIQAERARPNDPRLFVLLATQAYMRFQYPQMERAAVEGLRRWPRDIVLMTLLSEANRLQGRPAQAERWLGQIKAVATQAGARTACLTGLARLYLSAAWNKPRYAEGEKAARGALAITPGDTDARYWLARSLELQGRGKEALPHYEMVWKRDPEFEQVAFHLARLYLRAGDATRRAEGKRLLALYRRHQARNEQYRNARERVWQRPELPQAHREMGREYLNAGQLPQAVVELRQAVRMRPSDVQARQLLVQALAASGRLTEAKAL